MCDLQRNATKKKQDSKLDAHQGAVNKALLAAGPCSDLPEPRGRPSTSAQVLRAAPPLQHSSPQALWELLSNIHPLIINHSRYNYVIFTD